MQLIDNSDFGLWMARTFVRVPSTSYIDVSRKFRLVVKAMPNDVNLDADQARELAWRLRKAFCPSCGGTGFDPDTLSGNCDTCWMPF